MEIRELVKSREHGAWGMGKDRGRREDDLGLRNADWGLRRGTGHGAWSMEHREIQRAAGRKKKAEDRGKIVDLRFEIADWGLRRGTGYIEEYTTYHVGSYGKSRGG
jgi:hypothetical protein